MSHPLDVRITEEFAAGHTVASIAAGCGCHPDTVRNRIKALGLPLRNRSETYTPEDDALMLAEYAAGTPLDTIAAKVGRTRKSVSSRLLRIRPAGTGSTRMRQYTPEEDAFMVARRSEGWSLASIGKAMGRDRDGVRSRLSKLDRLEIDPGRHLEAVGQNRDDEYVALCLAHGGFVRMERVNGQNYLITPNLPARAA